MATRDGDPRFDSGDKSWRRVSFAATAAGLLALFAMAYNFGHQPSHSEKYGTVTETEAADGVRPSLSPEAGIELSGTSETESGR